MRHVLNYHIWLEAWRKVRHEIGEDFEEEWKQKLWSASVQLQGLEGLEMLSSEGVNEKWKQRLELIRDRIRGMQGSAQPQVIRFDGMEATTAPNMVDEVDLNWER